MKYLALALVGALSIPSFVQAQTCANPLPIQSNSTKAGTTCTGTSGLDLGGTVYPHPSIIYSFVAQNANASITFTASPDREMSLVAGCNQAPLAIGFNGGPLVIAPNSLANGTTYYLVVSSDPSLAVGSPTACGAYSISVVGTLPVALKNFSVE